MVAGTSVRGAGKAFKGSIDDMIRGGSKGKQTQITQYGSSGSSAGGGVLGSIRGLAQRPMTFVNDLFAGMPGPLSALGTNRFPVLGFSVSTGLALVLGYLAYRRYM